MSPRSQPPVDALDREAVERFEHSKRLWCGATLTEPDGYRRCCTRPPHRDPIHIESEDCDPPMVARWQDEPGAARVLSRRLAGEPARAAGDHRRCRCRRARPAVASAGDAGRRWHDLVSVGRPGDEGSRTQRGTVRTLR